MGTHDESARPDWGSDRFNGDAPTGERCGKFGGLGRGEVMKGCTTRTGWWMVIPALTLAVWLAAMGAVAWHSLGRRTSRIGEKLVRLVTNRVRAAQNSTAPDAGPSR